MDRDVPGAADALALLVAELGAGAVELILATETHRLDGVIDKQRRHVGGLLAVLVQEPSVVPLIRRRFVRYERAGTVAESAVIEVAEGHLVVARVQGGRTGVVSPMLAQGPRAVEPPGEPDATRRPVAGAEASEIDTRRAGAMRRGDDPRVGECDGAGARLTMLGVLVANDGATCPSVAGLAVYGHRPELWLRMLRVELVRAGATTTIEGPIPAVVDGVCAWKGWPEAAARSVVRPAIVDALAWRDWDSDQPIVARVDGVRIVLQVPGLARTRHPTLLRLMGREGLVADAQRPFGRIDAWLAERGLRPASRVRRDASTEVVFDVPAAAQRPATTREAPQAPRRELAAPLPSAQTTSAPPASAAPPSAPVPAQAIVTPPHAAASPADERTPPRDAVAVPSAAPVSESPRPFPDAEGSFGVKGVAIEHVQGVIGVLQRGPAATQELIDELGVTRSVIRAALGVLEEDGRVRPELESRSSPFQRWILVDASLTKRAG